MADLKDASEVEEYEEKNIIIVHSTLDCILID